MVLQAVTLILVNLFKHLFKTTSQLNNTEYINAFLIEFTMKL